jgi:hypothetical protein
MHEPHDQQHGELPELSSDDRRWLDALVEAGFDADALEPLSDVDRRRVQRLVSMFQLLHDYPVEEADDALLDATLARISRFDREHAGRMTLDPETAELALEAKRGRRRLLRVPLPDFITVAAMLLIVAGVGWPILNNVRQNSLDAHCANNLRTMGIGFADYASDYDGAVPMAEAGMHNTWSSLAHNVINLRPMLDGGYCDLGHLDCPGHEGEVGESYSYQWQVSRAPAGGSNVRISVLLGDRNPIIDAVRNGTFAPPLSISLNHGGRGQNVLWSDGAIVWLSEPVVRRSDNIWLPTGVRELRDGVPADDPSDTFLAH